MRFLEGTYKDGLSVVLGALLFGQCNGVSTGGIEVGLVNRVSDTVDLERSVDFDIPTGQADPVINEYYSLGTLGQYDPQLDIIYRHILVSRQERYTEHLPRSVALQLIF
jgi:hypothetical protein